MDDESQFVRRLIAGEPDAWRDWVRGSAAILHSTVARALGAAAGIDPEDVVQAVYAKLWADDRRRLKAFRGTSRLSTWLVAVAHREALDRLRASARTSRGVLSLNGSADGHESNGLVPAAKSPPPDRAAVDRESLAALLLAVDRLPPRDRLLVRLVHVDGRPYAEVALLLAVPENSIGPWLLRARERLRTLLAGTDRTTVPGTSVRPAYERTVGDPLTDEVGS